MQSKASLFCFQIKEQKQHCVIHNGQWRCRPYCFPNNVLKCCFIFSIIWTLGYPDFFIQSQQVQVVEVWLYNSLTWPRNGGNPIPRTLILKIFQKKMHTDPVQRTNFIGPYLKLAFLKPCIHPSDLTLNAEELWHKFSVDGVSLSCLHRAVSALIQLTDRQWQIKARTSLEVLSHRTPQQASTHLLLTTQAQSKKTL